MRHSGRVLAFFLGLFGSSLLAVGFADGGHRSSGRPADLFCLDVEDAADGWNSWCTSAWENSNAALDAEGPAHATDGPPGSEGWLALILPGSPLVAMLYIDDSTACDLACAPASSAETAATPILPANDAWADCAFGPWADSPHPADEAFAPAVEACDELGWADPQASSSSRREVVLAVDCEDLLAISAGAVYAGLPPSCILSPSEYPCLEVHQPVWTGCGRFVDASVAGWLPDADTLATAQLWIAVGQAAQCMVRGLLQAEEQTLENASRQFADCLGWALASIGPGPTEPTEKPAKTWPNARSTGVFLAL